LDEDRLNTKFIVERFNPILGGTYQAHLHIACSKGDKRLNKSYAFVQALAPLFCSANRLQIRPTPLGATCAQICCARKGLPIEALAKIDSFVSLRFAGKACPKALAL
jgi:hypothetical protein